MILVSANYHQAKMTPGYVGCFGHLSKTVFIITSNYFQILLQS